MALWDYSNNVISILQQIEAIENPEEKKKVARKFFKNLAAEYSRDIQTHVNHFLEIGSNVTLLSVPESLMNALKESIFCYVNEQYLSTIAATGTTAELFCVHLFELYLKGLGIERQNIRRRVESFENISQFERINILFSVVGVDDSICQMLHEIRRKRNGTIHPNEGHSYKEWALDCLQNINDVLNLYSEQIVKLSEQQK